jgi:leader peptidase (prepilin peptidase)/N-methyltransferase
VNALPLAAAASVGAAAFGLVVGWYLTLVIRRVPRGESTLARTSVCPRCAHRICARDNVPVLSWLRLRGRCRDCGERIPARYPLIELGTALAFAVVTAGVLFGRPERAAAIPALLLLAALSIALGLIDIDTHRLPNAIVLPAYPAALTLLLLASAVYADWAALGRAAAGAAVLFLFYFALAVITPRGMGFGDVKLAGVLGLYLGWFGWAELLVGASAAFLLGGGYALALLVMRRATRRSGLPFGPWMLMGAWVGIVSGDALARSYLALVGFGYG